MIPESEVISHPPLIHLCGFHSDSSEKKPLDEILLDAFSKGVDANPLQSTVETTGSDTARGREDTDLVQEQAHEEAGYADKQNVTTMLDNCLSELMVLQQLILGSKGLENNSLVSMFYMICLYKYDGWVEFPNIIADSFNKYYKIYENTWIRDVTKMRVRDIEQSGCYEMREIEEFITSNFDLRRFITIVTSATTVIRPPCGTQSWDGSPNDGPSPWVVNMIEDILENSIYILSSTKKYRSHEKNQRIDDGIKQFNEKIDLGNRMRCHYLKVSPEISNLIKNTFVDVPLEEIVDVRRAQILSIALSLLLPNNTIQNHLPVISWDNCSKKVLIQSLKSIDQSSKHRCIQTLVWTTHLLLKNITKQDIGYMMSIVWTKLTQPDNTQDSLKHVYISKWILAQAHNS